MTNDVELAKSLYKRAADQLALAARRAEMLSNEIPNVSSLPKEILGSCDAVKKMIEAAYELKPTRW